MILSMSKLLLSDILCKNSLLYEKGIIFSLQYSNGPSALLPGQGTEVIILVLEM